MKLAFFNFKFGTKTDYWLRELEERGNAQKRTFTILLYIYSVSITIEKSGRHWLMCEYCSHEAAAACIQVRASSNWVGPTMLKTVSRNCGTVRTRSMVCCAQLGTRKLWWCDVLTSDATTFVTYWMPISTCCELYCCSRDFYYHGRS